MQHARTLHAGQPTQFARWFRLILSLVFVAAGCTPREVAHEPELPITRAYALRPEWAVAVVPYVRLYASPSLQAAIVGHLRAGDVVRVASAGTTFLAEGSARYPWHEVELGSIRGWAIGSGLEVHPTRERAEDASRRRSRGE